ncbi:winged helix-turn-helix transcriptional regulator [Haloactinopolyspora alba]|uniref:winged helix-turn-helix transcriptional regulator n=1 Tax=Haloactinopolyspora alba TaxID=648780 RepID=UPI0013EB9D6A|nr:helix-turn-helix domain-containing protein [Haloactinopolyspora alba]
MTTTHSHQGPGSRRPNQIDDEDCRVFQVAVELAGKKWSAAILLALARGATRFSEIRTSVDGLSDRLLAARLRELETNGLVEREVIPSFPAQIRYGLTQAGIELIRTLRPLVAWAERWKVGAS